MWLGCQGSMLWSGLRSWGGVPRILGAMLKGILQASRKGDVTQDGKGGGGVGITYHGNAKEFTYMCSVRLHTATTTNFECGCADLSGEILSSIHKLHRYRHMHPGHKSQTRYEKQHNSR